MAHTYLSLRVHLVWATRRRQPWIDAEWRTRLWAHTASVVAARGGRLVCAGGTRDHVHLYVELPSGVAVADLVAAVKASTTKWIRRSLPHRRDFCWQGGYGAFSVSGPEDARLRDYIRDQERHHQERSFTSELLELLDRHDLEPDLTANTD